MTLKDKFKIINCTDCDVPYCDIKCTILAPYELDKLEQIADEFAIGFAEWLRENYYDNGELWTEWNSDDNTHSSKELLEIYKKEKGL